MVSTESGPAASSLQGVTAQRGQVPRVADAAVAAPGAADLVILGGVQHIIEELRRLPAGRLDRLDARIDLQNSGLPLIVMLADAGTAKTSAARSDPARDAVRERILLRSPSADPARGPVAGLGPRMTLGLSPLLAWKTSPMCTALAHEGVVNTPVADRLHLRRLTRLRVFSS